VNTKTFACEASTQNDTKGHEEGSQILFEVINHIFENFGPYPKFQNPSNTQSGEKVSEIERKIRSTFDGCLDCVGAFNGLLCWSVILHMVKLSSEHNIERYFNV
jgi:hypothetical protein